MEPLHFVHRLSSAVRRFRSGYPDPDPIQPGRDAVRPGRILDSRRWLDTPAARTPPALPSQFPEAGRRVALYHHHHVVKRRVRLSFRVDAARIAGFVLAGIPAPTAQIDAAGESDPIVDHYHLLMMRCTFWMHAIETKMKSRRRL